MLHSSLWDCFEVEIHCWRSSSPADCPEQRKSPSRNGIRWGFCVSEKLLYGNRLQNFYLNYGNLEVDWCTMPTILSLALLAWSIWRWTSWPCLCFLPKYLNYFSDATIRCQRSSSTALHISSLFAFPLSLLVDLWVNKNVLPKIVPFYN